MDTNLREFPVIIQGGMGAGVSGWRLARAVSQAGQLGVVSGTALSLIMARRLQLGDAGGHVRRALGHFPFRGIAERIVERYFIPGGKPADTPFKAVPVPALPLGRDLEELTVASNFAEVFLAKEGHRGVVGINYLEKIQTPTLASLYGSMLAGVDFVLMGAGIPRTIPGIMDALSKGQPVKLKIDVKSEKRDEEFFAHFDPADYAAAGQMLNRPQFLAIVAAATLAAVLAKKSTGKVNGFVVEGPTAGGHNAPPRGPLQLNSLGEPIYTERDDVDLRAMVDLGLPFWLAGSYGEPERITEALRAGACGVQVGTAFAYCDESDLAPEWKRAVLQACCLEGIEVFTDPLASPTGFPFKVVQLENTLSNDAVYAERRRICDAAFLRHAYALPDGTVGWRCPAEPESDYVRKGGSAEETRGRKCICNGLLANIGLGQRRADGSCEKPLLTSGLDARNLARFLDRKTLSYTARNVIDYLLSGVNAAVPASASCACEV